MKRTMRILALVSGLMVAAVVMFIGCTIVAPDYPFNITPPQGEEEEQGEEEKQEQEQEQDLIVNKDPNLAVKFGVIGTEPGAVTTEADVTKTLEKIHTYLGNDAGAPDIKLGDYIDLPGLTVKEDGDNEGAINITEVVRVLVVGKNSFKGLNGDDETTPHLVFQFEDALVARKMLSATGSRYSYIGSGMQAYLKNEFLKGLGDAGVDDQYFFEPSRRVAESWNGSAVEVKDLVWLPTEWEMFGEKKNAPIVEGTGNQVWLEYYNTGSKTTDAFHRTKALSSTALAYWWLASPHADSYAKYACAVSASGDSGTANAVVTSTESLGFAPAFCIK